MRTLSVLGGLVALLVAGGLAVAEETQTIGFDSKAALSDWQVKGDVSIDMAKDREGGEGSGALKIGPGGSAILTFQDAPRAGTVEFWAWEDTTSVAKPKAAHDYGVLYGIGQGEGKPALVSGAIYAHYLVGDKAYALGDFTPGSKEMPSHKVFFLGIKRSEGWHKWTFQMDPEKGLTVLHNGKNVGANRFNWNKSRMDGLSQVVLFGDKAGGKQMLWIDDVSVTPGAAMKAKPTPPPPPPPATPEKDPELAADERVELVAEVAGKHPRLLFTEDDIPALQALAKGKGKPFWDLVLGYIPACQPPESPGFLGNATDGQRQGFWRMPTVAIHYAVTKDPKSLEKGIGYLKLLAGLNHWETGRETDSGMSSANIMTGAAILYDALYHDLEPEFRDQFRDKLLLMARRQYYRGHLKKAGASSSHYWQNDPQNNHRWHRDAGLVLATLAIAGECDGKEQWLLKQVADEVAFVNEWMPDDGTSHEGPGYMSFGGAYLALVDDAADRCLGTSYLQSEFWKNTPMFCMQTLAPGLTQYLPYGDTILGGTGFIHDYNLLGTGVHDLEDLQAGLMEFRERKYRYKDGEITHNNAFMYGWMGMIWYNPEVSGGSLADIPTRYYFPDMGLVCARDGWEADDVGMLFKCGPYGGYEMNAYRKAHDMTYVNVAHDDPDANSLVLYADGGLVLPPDAYSLKKNTAGHNTILVGGKAQKGSGAGFTQPLRGKDADMSTMAVVTTYKDAGKVVVAEGEASNAYHNCDRYRRAVIWVEGKYVLVLDDIRCPEGTEITWLNQSRQVEALDAEQGVYDLAMTRDDANEPGASIVMQLVASEPIDATIGDSPAAQKHTPIGFRQLQATMPGHDLRVAAVYDAWKRDNVRVKLTKAEDGSATVVVTGPDFADTWQWTPATDKMKPATFKASGSTSVEVGQADWAEIPYAGMGRQ